MKIALNKDYGGFEISQKAYERLIELGVKISKDRTSSSELRIHEYTGEDIEFYGRYSSYLGYNLRTNPLLIQVIEELGDEVTAKEMIKDYTYGKFVDPEAVPDHVNSALLNGYDEVQWMMKECREEFGA